MGPIYYPQRPPRRILDSRSARCMNRPGLSSSNELQKLFFWVTSNFKTVKLPATVMALVDNELQHIRFNELRVYTATQYADDGGPAVTHRDRLQAVTRPTPARRLTSIRPDRIFYRQCRLQFITRSVVALRNARAGLRLCGALGPNILWGPITHTIQ